MCANTIAHKQHQQTAVGCIFCTSGSLKVQATHYIEADRLAPLAVAVPESIRRALLASVASNLPPDNHRRTTFCRKQNKIYDVLNAPQPTKEIPRAKYSVDQKEDCYALKNPTKKFVSSFMHALTWRTRNGNNTTLAARGLSMFSHTAILVLTCVHATGLEHTSAMDRVEIYI